MTEAIALDHHDSAAGPARRSRRRGSAPWGAALVTLAVALSGCAARDIKIAHAQAVNDLNCANLAVQRIGSHVYEFKGCGASAMYECVADDQERDWKCKKD